MIERELPSTPVVLSLRKNNVMKAFVSYNSRMYFYKVSKASVLLLVILMTSCVSKIRVDTIIKNAKVYTVNETFEITESISVKNGKIIDIGSSSEILSKYNSKNIIDANGKYIYPGFNDGHSHFLGYGIMKTKYANLVGTRSFDEVVDRVIEHNKRYPGEWVFGRGWDQNDWEKINFPVNDKLNDAFPETPVILTRIDGHALIANNAALKLAGITSETKIDGGEVLLKDGKPTGVLIDNAMDTLRAIIPEFSLREKSNALAQAQADCFAVGLTTVTDAGLDKDEILLMDSLHKTGDLKMSVYAMISPTKENFDYFLPKGPVIGNKLVVSSMKLYIDGALGSRGALLLEPYSDAPHTHGLQLSNQKYYDSICNLAYNARFQVNTHAIGDSGNRIMLNTYAKYLGRENDRRWRIEHAQIVNPNDLHIFSKYSIIPSVQATHCTSDMYWADERLGDHRIAHAYAYNDLKNQLGWLVNGTDFPIEDISPLKTFYASVARKDHNDWPEEGFQMENALSREDALRSITIWPARGSFTENIKGSLEPGKVADFVILEEDIMTADEDQLAHIKIVSTFVDGKKVY